MSYHKLKICKHHVGSPWKLQEEVLEYIDAVSNDNPVMATTELSDLYGVIEEEAKKYGLTMDNLKTMSDLTKQVFNSGHRKGPSLYEDIKANAIKVGFIDDLAIAFMPNEFVYLFVKDGRSYSDDITKMQIVVETIKGNCHITDGSNNDNHLKSDVKMLLIDSPNTEIYFTDNTIIKFKAFNGQLLNSEFDADGEALFYIKSVCEA